MVLHYFFSKNMLLALPLPLPFALSRQFISYSIRFGLDLYFTLYFQYLSAAFSSPLSLHWYLSPDRPLGTNHQLFGGQYDAKICQRISLSLSLSFVFLHKIHSFKVWKFLLQNIAAPFWRLSNLKLNFHVNIEPMQTVFNLLFSRKPASRTPYHQGCMFKICISQDFIIANPKPKTSEQYHRLRALCANSLAYLCLNVKVSVSKWVPKNQPDLEFVQSFTPIRFQVLSTLPEKIA